ncbi:barstar family protein [Streptomyces sp. NPDC059917]|uniref:barstar family protein n=1 Tax=Streptomyces sp. NPDC059917 TaxID=3347002 RepID=UPI0036669BEC
MGELTTEDTSAFHIAPWMHVTTGGGAPLDQLLPTSGRVHVARLSGKDMVDEVSTFQQFSESLKFPEYFGWNWDAFYDCLRDLEWLSSDYCIVIVESADEVLADDDDAREEFFSALWRAGKQRSYTKRPEGVTLSTISIVLSCSEKSSATFAGQLGERFKNR